MGRDRELKLFAFSLYPLSFFLYSPFKESELGAFVLDIQHLDPQISISIEFYVESGLSLGYKLFAISLFSHWFPGFTDCMFSSRS